MQYSNTSTTVRTEKLKILHIPTSGLLPIHAAQIKEETEDGGFQSDQERIFQFPIDLS